jgi:hypothetical protein
MIVYGSRTSIGFREMARAVSQPALSVMDIAPDSASRAITPAMRCATRDQLHYPSIAARWWSGPAGTSAPAQRRQRLLAIAAERVDDDRQR